MSQADRRRVLAFLRGMTDPWIAHESDVSKLPGNTILRILRGRTISVEASRQELKVELSWRSLGGGKEIIIPVPKFMPGWALSESQEFTCRAPTATSLDAIRANSWLLRDFRPVPYRYLSVEALEKIAGYEKAVER